MPNWVRNTITTDTQGYPKLLSALVNEKNEVDFNKLSPMHEDLNITSGSGSYEDRADSFSSSFKSDQIKDQIEILDKFFEKFYTNSITQTEFTDTVKVGLTNKDDIKETLNKYCNDGQYDTFIKGYFNTRRYGYADWYSANRNLWGTKWNASESYLFEQDCALTFETAWSMPYPIIEKLSHITPLFIAYADEDTGSNFGIYKFDKGEYHDVLGILKEQYSDVLKDIPEVIIDYVIASAIFGNDNDAILCDLDSYYSEEECEDYFKANKENLNAYAERILYNFVNPFLNKYLVR